jgi:hypothetical protein
MYVQKALNLNKGVKLCLSKIVCYTITLVVVAPFERSFDQHTNILPVGLHGIRRMDFQVTSIVVTSPNVTTG